MKLLIDANLSPRLTSKLIDGGYAAEHVVDVDLGSATDDRIFDFATANHVVVVTADSTSQCF